MSVDTNKLTVSALADLQGSDLLRLWSQKYGGDTRLTLSVLVDYLSENLPDRTALTHQYEAPAATGFSVTIGAVDTWLLLTPLAAYAAGTVVLPAGSNGAEVLVNTTQDVTALTVSPSTGDTVSGAPSGLTAGDYFRLKYDAVYKRWYRVG